MKTRSIFAVAASLGIILGLMRVSPRTPGIASFSEDDLRPAPDIGQDSYEVLLEAGFERGAIDDLVKAGAVRQAKGGTA